MRVGVFFVCGAGLVSLLACSPSPAPEAAAPAATAAAGPAIPDAIPEAVNGWREYPLRDGVIKLQQAKWRTDVIRIPVKAKSDLEYKLAMKKGDGVVYSIRYEGLEHPGMMETEFHGHTEKGADGNGDLMFYSKAGGVAENGQFTAPWDGIHGWYLKNDGDRDANAILEVAGYYELMNDAVPK
jgi:hypothetical protein